MQQLDDLEIWKVPQEPPSEEPTRDVDEGTQSPDSPEKVDGPAQLSPEDMPGSERSPEEAEAMVAPVAVEKEDRWPPQGASEPTAAADPAGQSLDPSQAPASRQRKWAMEEIVIRDHLGQEVGCMDAVGQTQISLEREEELEDHTNSEGRCDRWSQPGPAAGGLGLGPSHRELASRDGPEGASPPAQDHLHDPSGILLPEDSHPTGPGDGPPEGGSLAPEAGGRGVGQDVGPAQKVQEMEPALALTATGGEPAPPSGQQSQQTPMETPAGQEVGEVEARPEPQRPGSPPEQLTASPPHPLPPGQEVKDPPAQEEAKIPRGDPVQPLPPTQSQEPELSLQGTKGSLPGQIPPQDNKGSLLDPEPPFFPAPSPCPPVGQNPSLPGSAESLQDPAMSSMQQASLEDEEPPSRQDPLPSSLEGKASHSQGEAPPLPVEDQPSPSLHAAAGALPAPATPEQPLPPRPEDQPLSGPPRLPPSEPEGAGPLPDTPRPSTTDQLPPLPEQRGSLPGTGRAAAEEPAGGLPQGSVPTPAECPARPPPSQTPPPEGEAGQSLPDQTPPVLQEAEAAPPLPGWSPASSLPGGGGDLPCERQGPPPSQAPLPPPEEAGSSPAPDQAMPTPLREAQASLPEVAKPSLPQGQDSPAPPLGGQPPAPNSAPHPGLPGTPTGPPNALPLSSQEPPQPLLDKQCARGSGDAGAGEVAEVLGNLHAEKQHLQKEAVGPGGISAKPGVLKSPGPTSNPTPNDSSPRSSANTAHPPPAAGCPTPPRARPRAREGQAQILPVLCPHVRPGPALPPPRSTLQRRGLFLVSSAACPSHGPQGEAGGWPAGRRGLARRERTRI